MSRLIALLLLCGCSEPCTTNTGGFAECTAELECVEEQYYEKGYICHTVCGSQNRICHPTQELNDFS